MRSFLTIASAGFLGLLSTVAAAQDDATDAEMATPMDEPSAEDTPPAAEDPAPKANPEPTVEPQTQPADAPAQPAEATPPPAQPPTVVEPAAAEQEPVYEPAPPPEPQEDDAGGGGIPPFSVRVDPFNWLLQGRLGLELEMQVWEFISAELVPVFVTTESPPWYNYAGRDKALTQHSDGIGPISGTSLGVGFWFGGKPFRGTVLRAIFTNYAYDYETRYNGSLYDSAGHTEQHLGATIGSYSRYGAFTLGGEFGLSTDLNSEERCIDPANPSGCDELQLAADPGTYYDVNGSFHPIYIEARFSLGVTID